MSNSLDLAKNRGHTLLSALEAELRDGKITEAQWYEKVQAVITPAYLSAPNPRAQSGHSGDEEHWRQARGLIAEAVDRSGTFLDIGCANGHLMETLDDWCRERGHALEMHGLDIAPELVELARNRLPRYAPRIYVGNAFGWQPPKKFDFVRTGLEYVPSKRQTEYVSYLMNHILAPGGRLLVGTFNEEREAKPTADFLRANGFAIDGEWEREHRRDARLRYRVIALRGA